jgi:integrase
MGARALRFAILTAARTNEILGAKWSDIDHAGKVWTIPAERMKGGREHRVPLSAATLAVLKEMRELRRSDFIFPGQNGQLSDKIMQLTLRRLGCEDVTVHGFRSSFRDWAAEQTSFPREVAEMALAHAVGSEVERAYARTDLFERRRKLMEEWATYCGKPAAKGQVVAIRGRQ